MTKRRYGIGRSDLEKKIRLLEAEIESLKDELAKSKATVERYRKLDEEIDSLRKDRYMLRLLLDHSKDAIYFKDLNSRYLCISRAHPALQYVDSPDEAIGKTDFDYFPLEHAQQAFEDEMHIIATGEPILGFVERETASGMPEKWVFTSKLPIYDDNGKIIGTFGISRDITEIKKFENELQKTKDELEERVRKRTIDLQTINKDLERRIAQLDFLTSTFHKMAQCAGPQELSTVVLNAFSSMLKRSAAALCIFTNRRFFCIAADGILNQPLYRKVWAEAITILGTDNLNSPKIIGNWIDALPDIPPWRELKDSPLCIAVPLLADNKLVAVIHIFGDDAMGERFKEEEKVILTLSAHAAVCISNAVYHKEMGEKAQLQGELEAARSIQQRLTPNFNPSIPRVYLKGLYSPAYEVGGDYLDYFKNEVGCWVVVVADVCGKGIPAALLMTMLRSAFRVEAAKEVSAKRLLCAVNCAMQSNLDGRSFVTAVCLIINPEGTQMSYARAGHPRLIRIAGGSNKAETFESDGIALGILADKESFARTVEEISIPLNEGDRFFIYTDGLTEAFNPKMQTYSIRRLMNLLESGIGKSPDEMIGTVFRDIKEFTEGEPAHDDLTMIAMEVRPDPIEQSSG